MTAAALRLALLAVALLVIPGAAAPEDLADAVARSQAAARERAGALMERGGPYTAEDARGFLELALVDPERFATDGAFRGLVLDGLLDSLLGALPAAAPPELRDRILHELATGPGLTFPQSEALELAWGSAERASAERRAELEAGGLDFPDELRDPVAAWLLSFPSTYLEPQHAGRLLTALRRAAPERELVVLADLPMRRALEGSARSLDPEGGVHWIETYGRPYSPWPRDPFATARLPDGGLVLVERPAFQGGREGDRWMARELVQNLPPELDRAWGDEAGVRWGEAPFFFHNGHVLMAGGAAWTSIHGLEKRALAILGLDRVPVESFGTAEGIDRYLEAVQQAADGMAAFYGKPVRLVHPLPRSGSGTGGIRGRAAVMRTLGGGAGFDLDSLVTFLPGRAGGPKAESEGASDSAAELTALVGELDLGRELLGNLSPEDRRALRATYGFAPPARELPEALAGYHSAPRGAGLDAFLDLVAEHLADQGLTVRRLPLVLAPVALLEDRESYPHEDFMIGWQNVVLDPRPGGLRALRAEGFASGIPAGDEGARAAYREAGAELVLHPPLVRSLILNGGLRCASNQIRAAGSGLESRKPRQTLSQSPDER